MAGNWRPKKIDSAIDMDLERSAMKSMHLLISFIAIFAVILQPALFGGALVSATEVDIEVGETSDKHPHEHVASLRSDVSFLGGDDLNSEVESVPFTNSSGRSGKLYNYDDYYLGSLDQYPQFPDANGGYDYGE